MLPAAAFIMVVLGGVLAASALLAGEWVGASATDDSKDDSKAVSFGFGPLGACSTLVGKETSCIEPSEISKAWEAFESLLNPSGDKDVTGQNVGAMLSDLYNLMATAVRATAVRRRI